MIYADDNIHYALEKVAARPSLGQVRALEALTGAAAGGTYGALSKPSSRNRETSLDRALTYGAVGAAGAPSLSLLIRRLRGRELRKKMKASGYTPEKMERTVKALKQIQEEMKTPIQLVPGPGGGWQMPTLAPGVRTPAELGAEARHFAEKGKKMLKGVHSHEQLGKIRRKYMGIL